MNIFYLFIYFAVECCSGGIAPCLHLQEPTLCQVKTMWHIGDKGQEDKPMPPQLLRVSDCAGLLKQYELYACPPNSAYIKTWQTQAQIQKTK